MKTTLKTLALLAIGVAVVKRVGRPKKRNLKAHMLGDGTFYISVNGIPVDLDILKKVTI